MLEVLVAMRDMAEFGFFQHQLMINRYTTWQVFRQYWLVLSALALDRH